MERTGQDHAEAKLAVAYMCDPLLLEIDRNGLRVATERRGTWRSQPTHDQDVLILKSRDAARD